MRGWLLLACAAALAGCYDQPKPNCTFVCGEGGACPDDYQCGTDDLCHLVLPGGALAECGFTIPDGPTDARVDAAIDAPMIDAAPDAAPDASLPDADPPDAPPDAPLPPDAAPDAPPLPDAPPAPDAAPDAPPPPVEIVLCPVAVAATITTTSSAYVPPSTTINAGETIEFNPGGAPHDMVSGTVASPDGLFATPTGDTVCLQFNVAGTYPFFCSVHTFTGSITVN
jgi:hypothetical protein